MSVFVSGWFEWLLSVTGFDSTTVEEMEPEEMEPEEVSLYVTKSRPLGQGRSKIAFSVEEKKNTKYCFTLPSESDVGKFCLVEYKTPIDWIEELPELTTFRKKMQNDPVFRYAVDQDNSKCRDLYRLYIKYEDQFDCIAELKKMFKLSTEINGRTFAPKLHKIKIDDITNPDEPIQGIPFSPEDMDYKFSILDSGSVVKISYLIKRCDTSIVEIVYYNPDKIDEVCANIIEFIDSYVNTYNELNSDIKSENFCTTIVDGSVTLIELLDVDPKFCIKDTTIGFKRHAKNFIKYAVVTHSAKVGDTINGQKKTINFGNLGLTQDDVDEMIRFFYQQKYMIYEYNPINMLYHYFVTKHPDYHLVKLPAGWIEKISTMFNGKLCYVNKLNNTAQFDYPENYEFLYNDELMTYFTDVNVLITVFQSLNLHYGIVLLADNQNMSSAAKPRSSMILRPIKVTKRGGNPRKHTRKA